MFTPSSQEYSPESSLIWILDYLNQCSHLFLDGSVKDILVPEAVNRDKRAEKTGKRKRRWERRKRSEV